MTLVLVVHGTRTAAGTETTHALAAEVRDLLPEVAVRVAFADVRQPDVTTTLRAVRGRAVVVPAFLAAGYHVRVDVPTQIAAAARRDPTVLTPPLGPSPSLVAAMHDHLTTAGWRPGDAVVMAAAGSSDPRALTDVHRAATLLSARTGTPVHIGYAATATPRIAEVVTRARSSGARVAIASWLLAPGLFHRAIANCPADVIGAPLGTHPGVAALIARRYTEAVVYRHHHPAAA